MTEAKRPDAVVNWISGPVLRATTHASFHLNEAVKVGRQQLLGEVIRINGNEAVIQVYEDTTGLRPGVGSAGPTAGRRRVYHSPPQEAPWTCNFPPPFCPI